MEQLSMTPAHRRQAQHAYRRTADAFETVAWRPPMARRFDSRPANDLFDPRPEEPTLKDMAGGLPAWFIVVAGGAVAALTGALLGGALQV